MSSKEYVVKVNQTANEVVKEYGFTIKQSVSDTKFAETE